jgi:rhodanese-related sulfurtransferase
MAIEEVDVDTLAAALAAGARVVDVREDDEYLAGHVPGATHVALGTVPEHVDAFRSMAGETVYVICKAGGRSMRACEYVAQFDVPTINVAGGTMAWMMAGHDVVTGASPS